MTKRKSMKGKGADIFLGKDVSQEDTTNKVEQKHTSMEEQKHRSKSQKKNLTALEYQKVGYYFPPELVEALEEVWFQARSITKRKISKSDIVRAALEEAIAEFREKKANSALVDRIIKEGG